MATFLLLTGCTADTTQTVISGITPESVLSHVRVLADDSLSGRRPGTPGELKAVSYLEERMRSYGLEPAGENGTFRQAVEILSQRLLPGSTTIVRGGGRSVVLTPQKDIVFYCSNQQPTVDLQNVGVVFVGYGIVAPEQQWDDFKDADVRGKVLLFLNDEPPSVDPRVFGGKARTYYGRWTYKYEIAAQKGAVGAIIIHTDSSAGYPWSVVAGSWGGENLMLASGTNTSPLMVKAWMTIAATQALLALDGRSFEALTIAARKPDFRPVRLNATFSTSFCQKIRTFTGINIIGRIAGRDPDVRTQTIMFTSHHDHLGTVQPVNGDSICNGALDNASGCALTLELARNFAALAQKPKRSLVFAFVTGEEDGLLGSSYLAAHPTVALKDVAALINIDGININGETKDMTFIGYDRSSLGNDLSVVAGAMGLRITPDQFPEQGSFYRSDHFSFAEAGVPCLSLDSGTDFVGRPTDYARRKSDEYNTEQYHQPSDQLSTDWQWNLDGALQQAEFVTRLTVRLAEAETMPVWNAGEEFEAVRKRSLNQ